MKELLSNVLPYMGIQPEYNEKELKLDEVKETVVGDYYGMKIDEAKNKAVNEKLNPIIDGNGNIVTGQFPDIGSSVSINSKIMLYTEN